ncbi:CmpA/NrtA family ABC transporter substrate-binding protein [Hyphomicrobium sp. DMF-1]|jgi:NitT/TauT family transport system ATP-binding protein/nitrate/nitrite transport system substrate-binding protein|uniref:CmpA/NrtA family ABC transporter substrate-binding protein n=1 Tax=Hyphomicrobium sp. DMF-1 TaxID=3019544 RepID=UPI0022EBCB56|nr:CmpA/NrtA family ABC transporter substrate-binding protein [Hyphomicrobium sp. DMF-1]WBT38579.1 CmpA/NrtA family ABC transporter substrate-binding protein [Hyphomicrobium sp. DMF-1]
MTATANDRGGSKLREVTAGFIPLVDCAPLVIASELGFDRQHGLSLVLHREVSWANIRDKLEIGAFDCAHMLAPMPIAAQLGLGRATEPIIAPMALSLNGNAITVSLPLYSAMLEHDAIATRAGGMAAAKAVAAVVRSRQTAGLEPPTFGMVYPFSCHNYDLRYWLAAAGVDPDNDVNLVVVPPPLIADTLKAGRIDGFCVGQPWNSVAVEQGNGVIVATKSELWARSPEKVLGVREAWAERNRALVADLVRTLVAAGRWLDEPANRGEAARILSQPQYVGVAADILLRPLSGELIRGGEQRQDRDPDLVVFHRGFANFPWHSHAVWLMTQMIRWGQIREPFDLSALAQRVFRTDLYREAVAGSDVPLPPSDSKREGVAANEPGAFFGGDTFDPEAALAYLSALDIRNSGADLEAFASVNS